MSERFSPKTLFSFPNSSLFLISKTGVFVILISVFFIRCSDKYWAYKSQYQFKSETGEPDYANLNYWAAHPWKWDPADSVSAPFRTEKRDSSVDVFFLHPTIFTEKNNKGQLNAFIDDAYLNAKTDYSSILYQASVFNQHARVFAPRYREAHISVYFRKDTASSFAALDLAYADIKKGFAYYLQHFNNGRPIIIASHSQGTTHALRLMKEFFESTPLQKQLVTGYLVGMYIPESYFSSLKLCEQPEETGCICGWRTYKKGFKPFYVKNEKGNSWVTNPLTWKTDQVYAPRSLNKGSVLLKFNKLYKNSTDAQIHDGVIWTRKPKFPGSFLYFTRNYHAGDINLYYKNIRENVSLRIKSYFDKNTPE